MELNGAHIVLEVLREYSVDTVFGYPGNAVLDIYDALCDYPDIRHILTAHEQGAAHAADGYARASGKTGVVIATSGPGATNLVTGIAAAYMDSSPLVAITGNVCKSMLGHDGFQEVDISGITLPITKHSFIVSSVETLADKLRDAFRIASSGRKGPVLVDIPMDILCACTNFEHKTPTEPCSDSDLPYMEDIQKAIEMIRSAQRPLILAGGGVISSGAEIELISLAQKANIPVVSSLMGLGAVPTFHPLFLGMAGKFGHAAANLALNECDLLIAAGTRFSDRSADPGSGFAAKAEIIHIDIDSAELDKNVPSQLHIKSDIKAALSLIENGLDSIPGKEWSSALTAAKNNTPESPENAMPREIIKEIYNSVGSDGIIVTDVGQHQMWTANYYPFIKSRSFLTSGGLGAMGFGLGAAIGAKTAFPDRPVVLITGDGSFHMNCGELATVKKYDLPIKVVIMNNTVLGMVRQLQWFKYGRFSMTEPQWETDLPALVRAYGIDALKIKKPSQIKRRISLALKAERPVVVDCAIPSNAIVSAN